MTLSMQDSAGGSFTPGFDVYAGYVDRVAGGHTATFAAAAAIAAKENARALSITTDSDLEADIFDMENGAESYTAAPKFVARKTTARPILYCAGSAVDEVLAILATAGISRTSVRLLSAHYAGEHICGPDTCGVCSTACDGTQWAGTAAGAGTYDVSALTTSFFDTPHPTPQPLEDIDMKWGLHKNDTGSGIWLIIPGPTGLKKAGIANPADLAALRAMGAVTVTLSQSTVDALPSVAWPA